ncbi:MAG TPA: tetratricopeptide repeat protein [Polyangiales bacterium]
MTRWCVLWLWLLGGANSALAQANAAASGGESTVRVPAGDAAADEEGRGFFIAGRAAYLAGRYDEALERFERSYEMSGRHVLLYNIGSAAERAGQPKRALAAYRRFLEKEPDSELRPEVEGRIVALEARVVDEPNELEPQAPVAAAREASPPADTATPPRGNLRPWLGPSIALATSGAVLVTGVVLVALGYRAEQRVREAPDGADWDDYSDDAQRATSLRAAGFSVGAVGVVGAVLSSVWLAKARRDARSGGGPVAGLGYLGWRGSF